MSCFVDIFQANLPDNKAEHDLTTSSERDPILGNKSQRSAASSGIKYTGQHQQQKQSAFELVASSSGGFDNDKIKNNDNLGNASNRHDVPLKQPRYPLSHLFSVAVCALEAIGLIGFILLVVWLAQYHGGFAWDGSKREFNYHAVFMFLGIVFFYSNGKLTCFFRKE